MKRRMSFRMLTCVLLGPATLFATSMFQVGLPALSRESEQIVQATVTEIVVRWNKDSTQIETFVRMNIDEDLVADGEDNEIIIKQIGGTIGGFKLEVQGNTPFRPGEENVLFLFQDPMNNAAYQTIGMYQGKYQIFTTPAGVQTVSQDTTANVKLYKRAAAPDVIETGNDMNLEDFKNKILTYRNSGN